jgi:3-oxoacyl-[acyl-carrier protein] reductase
MDLGLEGKVALVGGGSRGLGRATAEALAREGAKVAIYARTQSTLDEAAAEIAGATGAETLAVAADVRQPEACARAVEAAVERFGRLDVVVPNMAGDSYENDLLTPSDEPWLEEFDLYALSVVRIARAAVPHLRAAGGGSIVNISSCGVHGVIPELALSEVVRLATAGFAKYLATQVAGDGIRVNSVLPGWIEGDLIDRLLAADAEREGDSVDALYEQSLSVIPLGRYGRAEEIADAIAFLASERARYITGANLRIDGGWAPTPTG